ncbi:MAG TPA: hypothetical protein ENJ18_15075 [Nannocystis exedens]|nr:hypothetical protein [Nannocystis exedens]
MRRDSDRRPDPSWACSKTCPRGRFRRRERVRGLVWRGVRAPIAGHRGRPANSPRRRARAGERRPTLR